jgi:hypothetical protein
MRGTIPPFPNSPSQYGAQLKGNEKLNSVKQFVLVVVMYLVWAYGAEVKNE